MQEFGWGVLGSRQEGGALAVPLWPYLDPPAPLRVWELPPRGGKVQKAKSASIYMSCPGGPPAEGHRRQRWGGTAPEGPLQL